MHLWSTSHVYIYLAFDASGEALAYNPVVRFLAHARQHEALKSSPLSPDYPFPDGVARIWRTYQGIAHVPGETVARSSSRLVSLAYKSKAGLHF
jgi:hypothetical protein